MLSMPFLLPAHGGHEAPLPVGAGALVSLLTSQHLFVDVRRQLYNKWVITMQNGVLYTVNR